MVSPTSTTKDVWVVVARSKHPEEGTITHAYFDQAQAEMVADIERINASAVAVVKVVVLLSDTPPVEDN